MAGSPSKGGTSGSYIESPYSLTYSYGDQNAGIVRGTPVDWFSPLNPIRPIAPPEIAGRQWDFQSGYNLSTVRRPYEPIDFDTLRQFAQTCDLLRLVIETRKDQVAKMKWKIARREEFDNENEAGIKAATAFFKRPDGVRSWADWLRVLLEDLFVVDAPALYLQRNRGGKLLSLFPLDGTTIKPVIDPWGRTPLPYTNDAGQLVTPVAYQQILKGYPAVDYSARDLMYRPRNVRSTTPYGFGPVEQIFTTINISLRRQLFLLNYFTEGNIPAALCGVPAEWTPDQIINYQRMFDDLYGGNLENRRKVKFGPPGIGKDFIQTQEPSLSGEFDVWLSKIIFFAFSIPPNTFSKNIANRASAEVSKEAAEEEGLLPILEWVKQLIDDVIEVELGFPDLEFVWQEENPIDEATQEQVLGGYTSKGILTINEARAKLGMDAYGDPVADQPMIITAAGYTPLNANTVEGKQANMAAFRTSDGSQSQPAPVGGNDGAQDEPKTGSPIGGGAPKPMDGKFAGALEKRNVDDEARDDSGRWTAGGAGSTSDEREKIERRKAAARERAAASRARAKQRAKEVARAEGRASGGSSSPRVSTESPEQEHADILAMRTKAIRSAVLITGGAILATAFPEAAVAVGIGKAVAKLGTGMMWSAAETSVAHILAKLGFEPEHTDKLISIFKDHIYSSILGKAATPDVGDHHAILIIKDEMMTVADESVKALLDYLQEKGDDLPLKTHRVIESALRDAQKKFKTLVAAVPATDTQAEESAPAGGDEAEKVTKAAERLAPVPLNREGTRKARAAIAAILTPVLAKIGKKAAGHVRAALKQLGKAGGEEDIADDADLGDFVDAVPLIGDELASVAMDSAKRTYARIGVDTTSDLMNQVNEDAVGAARARAAEMVGMRWSDDGTLVPSRNAENTITETTRDMIRTIIADGLADNIGTDAIADNIEASTAFSPERADLIAHTEVGNINSQASLDSAQTAAAAGVKLLKGWLTAGDDKVEDICLGNEAAGFIALDDDFPSGDAAPLAHLRCRCSLIYRAVATTNDDEGE